MNQSFSEYELEQILKLPKDVAILAQKYNMDLVNIGEVWEEPSLPDGHVPEIIEIYYGNSKKPNIFTAYGKLHRYDVSELGEVNQTLAVMFDGHWVYIQLESRILMNRLGGSILPDVIVEPFILIQSLLNKGGE